MTVMAEIDVVGCVGSDDVDCWIVGLVIAARIPLSFEIEEA